MSNLLLITNVAATLSMVGVIWMVQIVHYPLFAAVGQEKYVEYQRRHQSLMTMVVGPPMIVEAVSSVLLFWYPPPGVDVWMIAAGFVLLLIIWASTALVQVPCHGRLSGGFDNVVHRRLVSTNWIRTIAWTARGVLMIWIVVIVLSN